MQYELASQKYLYLKTFLWYQTLCMVVPHGMKVWELFDFGTDCLCNWKEFRLVIQGLNVAARKEDYS